MNSAERQAAIERALVRQLDVELAGAQSAALPTPSGGWLKTVRRALGMTSRQLARRMGMSERAGTAAETAEADGSITLKRLRAFADALDCDVAYVLLPRQGGLEEMRQARARAMAVALVEQADTHMLLEDQRTSQAEREAQVEELTQRLLQAQRKRIWEPIP